MSTERSEREVAGLAMLGCLALSKRKQRGTKLIKRVKSMHPEIEVRVIRQVLWSELCAGRIHADHNWQMRITALGKEFLGKADRR